jgi:hypothetical protein
LNLPFENQCPRLTGDHDNIIIIISFQYYDITKNRKMQLAVVVVADTTVVLYELKVSMLWAVNGTD